MRTKTWTTDAFTVRQQTRSNVAWQLEQGCGYGGLCHQGLGPIPALPKVYRVFYTADYVDHHKNEWDARHEERTADCMSFLRSHWLLRRDFKMKDFSRTISILQSI